MHVPSVKMPRTKKGYSRKGSTRRKVSRTTKRKTTRKTNRKRTTTRRKLSGNSYSEILKAGMKYGLPLAKGIATLTGYGDYTAGGVNLGDQVPIVRNTPVGCIVRHREYIGDLIATAGFVVNPQKINPSNGAIFPWLSKIAANFEEWIPRGIIFEYRTMSSDTVVNVSSGSPALGTVIMATDYNVYNPPFASKQQMEV